MMNQTVLVGRIAKIDEGYSILFPKGTFKCNLIMKPKITIEFEQSF